MLDELRAARVAAIRRDQGGAGGGGKAAAGRGAGAAGRHRQALADKDTRRSQQVVTQVGSGTWQAKAKGGAKGSGQGAGGGADDAEDPDAEMMRRARLAARKASLGSGFVPPQLVRPGVETIAWALAQAHEQDPAAAKAAQAKAEAEASLSSRQRFFPPSELGGTLRTVDRMVGDLSLTT